jgi:hypothetical protein
MCLNKAFVVLFKYMKLGCIKEEMIPGDFSFLPNSKIYEYDYRIIDKIGHIAWNHLKTYQPGKNDFVIEHILTLLYPAHTAKSLNKSLEYLVFIANHGWENFVKTF